MKQLLLILSIGLLTFGSGISQNRYSEDEVVLPPNDSITYLKFDMKPLNGVVYCEFGDLATFVNGKPDGLLRQWHENGQLSHEGNYKDDKKISEKEWDEDGHLYEDE